MVIRHKNQTSIYACTRISSNAYMDLNTTLIYTKYNITECTTSRDQFLKNIL